MTSSDEIVALLKKAAECGRIVVKLVAAPPSHHVMQISQLFNLTRAESRALAKLVERGRATRAELHCAISDDDSPRTSTKLLDVTICRLRQKLKPYEIKIQTIHGVGFQLATEGRDKVRSLLAEHDVDCTEAAALPVAVGA